MERRKTIMLTVIASFILVFAASEAFAGNKVLFYQSKTGADYRIAGEYSKLKEELQNAGYEVDELKAELTRENLNTLKADILVIANLGSDLTENEMTTLFEYVIKDGKGLFIIGTTPATNKLTIPLGIRALEENLEDDTNRIRDASTGELVSDKTFFYVDLPANRPDTVVNALTRGVNKLCIFSATGLHLFGNAKGLVFGGDSTNTPISLVFPKGSNPPVAAYIRLGSGSIVVVNDPDMFVNKNLDTAKYRHDNIKFAVNIMDWLAEPFQEQRTDQEVDNLMKALKGQNVDYNRTIVQNQKEIGELDKQITTLTSEKEELSKEISEMKNDKVMGLAWLSYQTLAMVILAFAFFMTAVVVVKKGRKPKDKKEQGELGYEFNENIDEEPPADDEEVKTTAKIKEEDVEERLRELQKSSK